jgi:hypothetical protein
VLGNQEFDVRTGVLQALPSTDKNSLPTTLSSPAL